MNNSESESSSSVSEEEVDPEVTQRFKDNVKQFVKLDTQQREYKTKASKLDPDKKPLEKSIIEYLDRVGLGYVEVNDGKLVINRTESPSPLTREIVIQGLKDKIGDVEKVADILKHMDLIREQRSKTRTNIKRVFKDEPDKDAKSTQSKKT